MQLSRGIANNERNESIKLSISFRIMAIVATNRIVRLLHAMTHHNDGASVADLHITDLAA